MREFKSWKSYQHFWLSVAYKQRYVREPEAEEFLATVLELAEQKAVQLESEMNLWRAQLGSSWRDDPEHPGPEGYPPERMKPRRNRATEGRVNPKGIPVLYLATTKETAMAEVRPWKRSYISVAQFKLLRDVRIVDFSTDDERSPLYLSEPNAEARAAAVWSVIDHAFSEPTERSDDGAEYVATQIIADAVRSAGFDGIAYQSGLEDGYNIALFDIEVADLINCCIYELRDLKFDFRQSGNPYFITKYYPELSKQETSNVDTKEG